MAETPFKDIRAGIKAIVEQSTSIQAVYAYEASTFSGFPAAVIAPSENAADYNSTQKDKLTFIFKVRVYYPIENESSHEDAETNLEAVFDELLYAFRARGTLTACDWLEPVPGAWYYEERGEGVYRVAEMTLRCIKIMDSI
jgi:hypothetical protein